MDMRSNAARLELERLAAIDNWKQFHQWLVLDWQGPEGCKWKEDLTSQVIEIAKLNADGEKITLHILNDPRRARRRYILDMLTRFDEFKRFEKAKAEYAEQLS